MYFLILQNIINFIAVLVLFYAISVIAVSAILLHHLYLMGSGPCRNPTATPPLCLLMVLSIVCFVFCYRQLIYNYPEQLFADAGVMAIEHADFEGVERLALVTGRCYRSRFEDL